MSIHAGRIVHLGANAVIDRLQSAGLGDVRVPTEAVREIGTQEIVDKVPGDPEFTFSLESLDVTAELEAWLCGKRSTGSGAMAGPGDADADGTAYDFFDWKSVNVVSPWVDNTASGNVEAGHLVPAYYPTAIHYRFGVSDNAVQTVELAGGAYYYGKFAPVEQFETGDGVDTTFVLGSAAVGHRVGGAGGTQYRRVHGVLVNGVPQTRGVDFAEDGPNDATAVAVTVTFVTAPASGADIRLAYFTTAAQSVPRGRHATAVNKPAAVRGRNICVYVGTGSGRVLLGGVQSAELNGTTESAVGREFCNDETTGREVTGNDVNGNVVVRSRDKDAFFALLAKVTGVPVTEIYGWLNQNEIELEIQIKNPKNPATVLKTLYVADAQFQIPGTAARVNQPTDFTFAWESRSGTYKTFKGAKP